MENLDETNLPNRKVTLSTRVYPEQKLMLAERANALGLSLSQYTESKVLQNDNLELEKTIQRQEIELEKWKAESERLTKLLESKSQKLDQVCNDFNVLSQQQETQISEKMKDDLSLELNFSNKQEKELFLSKLSKIGKKYNFQNLQSTLKACCAYAYENDNSIFFLETVKGFFKKKSNQLLLNPKNKQS